MKCDHIILIFIICIFKHVITVFKIKILILTVYKIVILEMLHVHVLLLLVIL